jgi:hypothetical protein
MKRIGRAVAIRHVAKFGRRPALVLRKKSQTAMEA